MNRNNLEHWRKRIVEGKPPRHYPPACPTCGATLPHDNPMALQYHDSVEYKRFFDEAVRRAAVLGRPFEESEVFAFIWDLGYELTPTMDDRFMLVREATGMSRRLWGLKSQKGTKS
jgi:hypothetical protein